ncbi:7-alpha-hydroxycholest-4-en-3-one 12-alpha-hydroxylase-like [Pantherophis guttatus]|uniref:7-alpha-hydroxycholest-4-en-3-one 12-alpha-hydroxylase-like n=1 Tax=Pantherophis guttatus TaxID=94885 RepID=A0A6P9DRV6_PANGU|nr:7-alpha-hydroxycholest-4-en-3-one 12-alpha-hydroxylase-like [Pantherophis guttatus]
MKLWEMVLCALLSTLISLILGGLYRIGLFRQKRPKEPPLDKGLIPWLGHGLSFGKQPVPLLQQMRKKHGDIFTILVGGQYIHVLMDPHTYGFIFKKSKSKLDFGVFASNVVSKAFNFQPTTTHHKIGEDGSRKYLRGKSLLALNQSLMQNLKEILLESAEEKWRQEGLWHFSYKTIFQAAFLSLFGTVPELTSNSKENTKERSCKPYEKLFEDFQQFDEYFPQMILNSIDSKTKKEIQRLKNYFWDLLSVEKIDKREDISIWLADQDQQLADAGMNEKMRTQVQLLFLWASQANTGPVTFWLLAYLLKHPEAMKAIRAEIDQVLKETGQEQNPTNLSLQAIKTPLLDSAVEEALRLKAGSFVFRSVMEDLNLQMDDGKEYDLRKGDHLLLFPFLGLHMDPEIYPEPETFKYDRFLSPEGKRKEFFKNGKKLRTCILPFGGGPSMCPGRFFAVSEIKIFTILMLTFFDIELVNPEEELPSSIEHRIVIATAHPTRDIDFKFRRRL